MWDKILGQGDGTGCANQHCFFGELVYSVAERYACVSGIHRNRMRREVLMEIEGEGMFGIEGSVWEGM